MTGQRIANRVGFYLLVAGILSVDLFPIYGTLVSCLANDQTQLGTYYLPQSLDPANFLRILHQRGCLMALGNPVLVATVTVGAPQSLYNSIGAMVVVQTPFTLPFSVWLLTTFLREAPVEIEEAAIINGATTWVLIT